MLRDIRNGSLGPSVARLSLGSELRLDFPTTPNPATDSRVRQVLRWACQFIIQYLGRENVHAIVLSGSLAVGEGSALLNANGEMKLLSDLDIYIVAKESSWTDMEGESTRTRLRAKNLELNSALNAASPPELLNPIDTEIVTRGKIRNKLRAPRIVTLQLAGTARVLWGEKDILPDTPPVSGEEITDEDVFRLFNNRIAEQVFYFVRYNRGLDGSECFVYHSAKAAVDTVLAVCAAARHCKPRLLDRLEIFDDLCHDPSLGLDMAEWAGFWTKFKIAPDLAMLAERFGTQNIETAALAAWDKAAGFLLRALHWSAKTRLGIDEESTEFLVRQLTRHLGLPRPNRPSLKVIILHPRRLLGYWLGYCRAFAKGLRAKNLPVPTPRRLKKLSTWGSPRSLTYGVATLLLAARGKPEIEQKQLLQMASNVLPVVEPPLRADVAEWWWELAVETARLWNMLVMGGTR